MSLAQKVKIYYSMPFLIGISIIYSILYYMLLSDNQSNKFTIGIAVFTVLFQVFVIIFSNYFNKYVCLILPFALVFIVQSLYMPINISLVNSVFIFTVNISFLFRYGDAVDYLMCKDDLRVLSSIVFFSIVILAIQRGKYDVIDIYRVIVVYLASVIIALREMMKYSYRIANTKRADAVNMSILAIIIMMCSSFASNIIFTLGKDIAIIISYAAGKLVMVLGYILGPLFELLYEFISSKSLDKDIKIEPNTAANSGEQAVNVENASGTIIAVVMKYLLIVLFIALAAVVIYKIIKALTLKSIDDYVIEDYEEDVESIETPNKTFRNILAVKKIPSGNREKVIYLYNKMIRTYKKRNIFKQYMTPGQFGNMLKLDDNNDNNDDIDEINQIYNEAKFSSHEISINHVKTIENSIKNILKKKGKI